MRDSPEKLENKETNINSITKALLMNMSSILIKQLSIYAIQSIEKHKLLTEIPNELIIRHPKKHLFIICYNLVIFFYIIVLQVVQSLFWK